MMLSQTQSHRQFRSLSIGDLTTLAPPPRRLRPAGLFIGTRIPSGLSRARLIVLRDAYRTLITQAGPTIPSPVYCAELIREIETALSACGANPHTKGAAR